MPRTTRQRILEVAEGFFGEFGYHGTRLHLIAQRVGIQKASLFHYFPSKEHLYHAVLEEGFGETEQAIRGVLDAKRPPLEKIKLLIEAYVDMVAAHPDRTKILLRQSLGDAPLGHERASTERLLNLVVTYVAEGQRTGAIAQIDTVAMVLSVVGMAAFFLTSAPVMVPAAFGEPLTAASVERVKRHVVEVVHRCLSVGVPARAAAAKAVTV